MPAVILMDYNLAMKIKDPKYRKGTEVIPELDRICEKYGVKRPKIVAFSTGKSENEELIVAGANWALNKKTSKKSDDILIICLFEKEIQNRIWFYKILVESDLTLL